MAIFHNLQKDSGFPAFSLGLFKFIMLLLSLISPKSFRKDDLRMGGKARKVFARKPEISFAFPKTALRDLLGGSIRSFGGESNSDLDLLSVLQKKTKMFCFVASALRLPRFFLFF